MAAILNGFSALAVKANDIDNRTSMTTNATLFMMRPPFVVPRLSGSGLPWPPARSLRLGERDCFEYAWVTLNRCDRWNKDIHV
jgi:hypothetical protein